MNNRSDLFLNSFALSRCVVDIRRAVVSGIVMDTSKRIANSVTDVLTQATRGKVSVSVFWPTLQQVVQRGLKVAEDSLREQVRVTILPSEGTQAGRQADM